VPARRTPPGTLLIVYQAGATSSARATTPEHVVLRCAYALTLGVVGDGSLLTVISTVAGVVGTLAAIGGVWWQARRDHGSGQPRPRAPRQLPAIVKPFTGRRKDLRKLGRLRRRTGLAVITGLPGVGKTALAVRWAHRAQWRFPGGQLYVNLRGYDQRSPVTPDEALDGFLRALQVPTERIPHDLDTKAALYRSELQRRRRVLVVLDNAASADDVRPLLPGSPRCAVVVTSRNRLSGLTSRDGAEFLDLRPLPADDAIRLLRRVVGATRIDDSRAAADVARLCGYLPLALRIAADRLAAHPEESLAELAAELERRRLDLLATVDDTTTAVRVVFSWSFRALPTDAARLFRLLGLHSGPDIATRAAAALADITTDRVRSLLEVLTGVHLVERIDPDRYRLHDLLRDYAAERTRDEDTADDRKAAARRLITWYFRAAHAARDALGPRLYNPLLDPAETGDTLPAFASYDRALSWYDVERANLVAVVRQAADANDHDLAWKLALTLQDFFQQRAHAADSFVTLGAGLAAARRLSDRYGEARILNSLGSAYRRRSQLDEALDYRQRSLTIFREIGDRRGEAVALASVGNALRYTDRYAEALDHQQRSLVIWRDLCDPPGEAFALRTLGQTLRGLRRYGEAIEYLQQSLTIYREIGNPRGEAKVLRALGQTYRLLGRHEEAIHCAGQAVAILRKMAYRYGEGKALFILGDAQYDGGQRRVASTSWRQALTIFREIGNTRLADEVEARLARRPGRVPNTPRSVVAADGPHGNHQPPRSIRPRDGQAPLRASRYAKDR
jgi:tetratricopeptide (TPR) repeat protein